ncbi:hypothetical protein B0J11DRAFT_520143 [Dendryphion nanum]|uniref:Secreted protein n=1 Tax=Dendryphion nanum TaxID=256645 RepID=A0A9P9E6R0_9PLEO|nr:hypothetical protein B0J11DRAFT_520143 [Dendryphion nanum]
MILSMFTISHFDLFLLFAVLASFNAKCSVPCLTATFHQPIKYWLINVCTNIHELAKTYITYRLHKTVKLIQHLTIQ